MSGGLGRLRWGEWVAAAAAILLAVSLFALHWYGGGHPRTGWEALVTLRWLVLVTVAVTLGAVGSQLRPGPALASALDVIALLLSTVTSILLAVRLATTGASLQAGAFVGLGACLAMLAGVFAALRAEQGWSPGTDRAIELVALAPDQDGTGETPAAPGSGG